jgi:hypothetical protein
MTRDEVDTFFGEQRSELDYLVMLSLLASAEAAVRIDFNARVRMRKKDPLSRSFRKLRNTQGKKIRLGQDILETRKDLEPEKKTAIGSFVGALRLRHWLAHGRYWNPKLGKPVDHYSPSEVYDITNAIVTAL